MPGLEVKVIKRALLLVIILVAGISIGVLSQTLWDGKNNHEGPPKTSGVEKEHPPANLETPDNQNSEQEPFSGEILPILGTSDQLTDKEWQDMLIWRQKAVQLAVVEKGLLYVNGPDSDKRVALTFDDGPDAVITTQVLEILKEKKVEATFFFKGNQVLKYKSLVQKVYEQGFLVESHAYSHQELSKMNRLDIDRELVATDQAIRKVIGHRPGLIRPPFGEVNSNVLAAARDNQQGVILWSIDTLDWSQQEPQHIADNVLLNVRAGDIILLHSREGQEATVQALPLIIDGLQERGYQLVNVASLLGRTPYRD